MDFRGYARRQSEGAEGDSDRRSLSSSFSEGTSRFFNSVIAKKNGLFSDLSNKIESVGATLMKSSPSGSSYSSGPDSPTGSGNQLYSEQTTQKTLKEQENVATKITPSASSSNGRVSGRLHKRQSSSSSGSSVNEENLPPKNVNMSFDEPLYSPGRSMSPSDKSVSAPVVATTGFSTGKDRSSPAGSGSRINSARQSPKMTPSSGHSSDSEKVTNNGKPPKFSATKRRSSTVDEMLFDDYVEPEPEPVKQEEDNVFNKRKTLLPMGDLISFDEPELEDFHPHEKVNRKQPTRSTTGDKSYPSVSSVGSSELEFDESSLNNQTSVDSSDVEYGGIQIHRSGSVGSDRSWSSSYSLDSQPDDLTLECMGFMKLFVERIFNPREELTQMEKAKFGEYCQQTPGRQWFARYVNSQRVNSKKVDEQIFFRLVQYFAVVLFECNESEDFSPAKSLMNMCFTFYHEIQHGKQRYKNFLYSYLREQPIWQSLRFWNAAFFDAVQNERAKKPVCTSDEGQDRQSDDNMFQENITFGQLGTFTCNMRAFGLTRELCLEFLRKQSIIASLKDEQVQMLKDNVDKWKEH